MRLVFAKDFMQTPTFEAALSAVLAHSCVYESRAAVDREMGHRDWFFVAGGDPRPSTAGESTDDMMKAWIANLPNLLRTQNQITNELAPGQEQSSLDLARTFLPQFTQVGLDQQRQQQLGQAGTDLATIQGPGKQLNAAVLEAQKAADPEYYAERAQAADALSKLFGSLDTPTGELSGSERAEIERSLNRDNAAAGIISPTATSTVSNALTFGNAGAAKKQQQQGAISNAVNTATAQMPAAKSGIDVLQTTLGRPSVSNTGLSQFSGIPAQGQANNAASGALMNTIGTNMANAQNINANRRDALDRATQVLGSLPSVSCCWLFRAKYGREIPLAVRLSRDAHYTPARRAGYRIMSKAVVPLMKYRAVRALLDVILFAPLTAHARWLCGENRYGWMFTPVAYFWLATWSALGSADADSNLAYS
jgi:hypothetical protein